MSKRQRFFVELIQDEVTVISWKKLVEDAEQANSETASAPPSNFPANSPSQPENLNVTAEIALKSIEKVKLAVSSSKTTTMKPLKDRNMNSASRAPKTSQKPKSKVKAKVELDERVVSKGKVHRSMPIASDSVRGKTSCRTKKKIKACFCCSEKDEKD